MNEKRSGASRREFIRGTGIVAGGLASGAIVSGPTLAETAKPTQASGGTPGARFANLIAPG